MNTSKEVKTKLEIYDPNKLSEKVLLPVKAKVVDIKQGLLGELIPAEILEKWKDADVTSPALEVVAECEDGTIRRRTIQIPADNSVHPNSNLARWRTSYGAYPFVGQEIELKPDDKGFYQFAV